MKWSYRIFCTKLLIHTLCLWFTGLRWEWFFKRGKKNFRWHVATCVRGHSIRNKHPGCILHLLYRYTEGIHIVLLSRAFVELLYIVESFVSDLGYTRTEATSPQPTWQIKTKNNIQLMKHLHTFHVSQVTDLIYITIFPWAQVGYEVIK